jgi:hypothetical protein
MCLCTHFRYQFSVADQMRVRHQTDKRDGCPERRLEWSLLGICGAAGLPWQRKRATIKNPQMDSIPLPDKQVRAFRECDQKSG